MRRRIAVIVALLAAWASFGLVIDTLFGREIMRCNQVRDLSADCFAPFALFFSATGLIFVLATLLLAILALRQPLVSDKN